MTPNSEEQENLEKLTRPLLASVKDNYFNDPNPMKGAVEFSMLNKTHFLSIMIKECMMPLVRYRSVFMRIIHSAFLIR